MKKQFFIAVVLVFGFLLNANAQSAGLYFDPKWSWRQGSGFPYSLIQNPSNFDKKPKPIPQAWCYSDLAFFCKIEVKMEKSARFPVKFRLGDVRYVDEMEGKAVRY